MIKITNKHEKGFLLSAIVKGKNSIKNIVEKNGVITDDINNEKAFVFFEKEPKLADIKALALALSKSQREYTVDVKSLISKDVNEENVVRVIVDKYIFNNNDVVYNVKGKKEKSKDIFLLNVSSEGEKAFKKYSLYAETVNYVRDLQTTPPNILNSEVFADKVKKDLAPYKNLKVTVFDKKKLEDLGMNVLLSVNKASKYEARVVIVEYNGNPSSKEKTTLVGKGITFDAGGMNIKTGKFMLGMKYDMSGAAISIGTLKAIAELKPKTNFSAIVGLTDNMVSNTASQPDSVYKAYNGKTVEVNNTDAEGRLVMADILTYAAKDLKSTRLIDIATLTGAVVSALGHTYTGTWSTTEKGWEDILRASKKADENIWRLPLHSDYFEFMKGSKVADMLNTDYTGNGGSSSAAMFLTQFNEGVEHIHLDIAGTAEIKGECQGPMVKTLLELANG